MLVLQFGTEITITLAITKICFETNTFECGGRNGVSLPEKHVLQR